MSTRSHPRSARRPILRHRDLIALRSVDRSGGSQCVAPRAAPRIERTGSSALSVVPRSPGSVRRAVPPISPVSGSVESAAARSTIDRRPHRRPTRQAVRLWPPRTMIPSPRLLSDGWCRSCSRTSSVPRRWPRPGTPRRSARSWRRTSRPLVGSSSVMAGRSRNSSGMRSWRSGAPPPHTRTTPSGRYGLGSTWSMRSPGCAAARVSRT